MRVALSGTSSRCFTVSPALISIFGVVLAVCGCCFCLVCVCFLFGCFVWFASPTCEIFDIF